MADTRVVRVADGVDFRDMGGTIRRLIHPSTVGDTDIQISVCFLNPGEEVVRHRHVSQEAYFVTRGQGTMYLEGHPEIRLEPNVAVHIPSRLVHGQKNTGDEPLVIVCALNPPLTVPPELVPDRADDRPA